MTDKEASGEPLAAEETQNPTPETEAEKPEETGETAAEGAEADGETAEPNSSGEEAKKRRPGGFQKKISKLQSERDYWRDAALKNQEKPEPSAEKAPEAPKPPNPDDFASFDDFITAKAEFIADQKVEQKFRAREEKEQKTSSDQTQREKLQAHQQRLEKTRERITDFDEVLDNSDAPLNQALHNAIVESELGPDIAYYLGKNPDKAAELVRMSPEALNRAIGRMEAELEAKSPGATKKVTKASAPFKPVNAGGSSGEVGKPAAFATQRAYEEWRKKGGGR